jgi:hypothetical protein
VIGTYRPAEVMTGDHPLRAVAADLLSRRLATELECRTLDAPAVERYLSNPSRRPHAAAALVPRACHERTKGNRCSSSASSKT